MLLIPICMLIITNHNIRSTETDNHRCSVIIIYMWKILAYTSLLRDIPHFKFHGVLEYFF